MEEQLKNWVSEFGKGTNNAKNYELKAFNDKYCLVYLKGKTTYTTRMDGNSYSGSEWSVCENLSPLNGIYNLPISLYNVFGRLTKEHKNAIEKEFQLTYTITKKERPKFENKSLLFFDADAFWGGGTFSANIFISELISEDEKGFTVFSKKDQKNKLVNKNKYKTRVVDTETSLEEGAEAVKLIAEYNELINKALEVKRKILDFMEKKV